MFIKMHFYYRADAAQLLTCPKCYGAVKHIKSSEAGPAEPLFCMSLFKSHRVLHFSDLLDFHLLVYWCLSLQERGIMRSFPECIHLLDWGTVDLHFEAIYIPLQQYDNFKLIVMKTLQLTLRTNC